LVVIMQKYEILGVIGEGAYGVVLRCRMAQTDELVAIKKFKENTEDHFGEKIALREVPILKTLNHPNIVRLKDAFRKNVTPYLVFEYLEDNLLEVVERSPKGLPEESMRLLVYQLLRGVAYLHSLGLLHRDIKPENVLVGRHNSLKICDFGFARRAKTNDGEVLTDYVATRWYRPPELLVGGAYGCEIDVWAVGTIMAELIDGHPLFPGEDEVDQLLLIQKCLGPLALKQQ
jgi:cyclin-dependent kinase-like